MSNAQRIKSLEESKQNLQDAINSSESVLEFEVKVHAESRIRDIDTELALLELFGI